MTWLEKVQFVLQVSSVYVQKFVAQFYYLHLR